MKKIPNISALDIAHPAGSPAALPDSRMVPIHAVSSLKTRKAACPGQYETMKQRNGHETNEKHKETQKHCKNHQMSPNQRRRMSPNHKKPPADKGIFSSADSPWPIWWHFCTATTTHEVGHEVRFELTTEVTGNRKMQTISSENLKAMMIFCGEKITGLSWCKGSS